MKILMRRLLPEMLEDEEFNLRLEFKVTKFEISVFETNLPLENVTFQCFSNFEFLSNNFAIFSGSTKSIPMVVA